jgi:hypothetical protein
MLKEILDRMEEEAKKRKAPIFLHKGIL